MVSPVLLHLATFGLSPALSAPARNMHGYRRIRHRAATRANTSSARVFGQTMDMLFCRSGVGVMVVPYAALRAGVWCRFGVAGGRPRGRQRRPSRNELPCDDVLFCQRNAKVMVTF